MANDEPGVFEITIGGAAGMDWDGWLREAVVIQKPEAPSVTVLRAPMDQATLRGVLNRMWDLNLTVISVIPSEPVGEAEPVGTDKSVTPVAGARS